jgi:hypothetical protein
MANVIKQYPTTGTGDPEILPWATGGTTLEPTAGQETTGWQPQAIAGPPDYRLENYARLNQSLLNARGVQTAVFLECCQAQITLTGYAAGVNQRRITINGVNIDITDGGGSVTAVRDAFIAAINGNPVTASFVTASAGGPTILYLTDTTPGETYSQAPSLVVSVLAGAGTIAITSPATTPIVREDAIAMSADIVLGSPTADDDGLVSHDARIVWRKSKGSFRAGTFTGTQADNANTGTGSVAFGSNPVASGQNSVAMGSAASATAAEAISIGTSSSAAAIGSAAIGQSATVGTTAANSFAATSGQVGNTCTNAVAMAGGVANNSYALASGGGNASGNSSIAIGDAATANQSGAVALGKGTITASGIGALSTGFAGSTASVTATADGAMAQGYAKDTGAVVIASGKGALAHGYSNSVSEIRANGDGSVSLGFQDAANINAAAGANSFAHGNACSSAQTYSRSTGYAAKTSTAGEVAHAAAPFTDLGGTIQQGSSQRGSVHVLKRTTDATDQILTPGVGAVSFNPALDTVYLIDCMVVAKKEATDDDYAMWSVKISCAYVAGVFSVKKVVGITFAAPAVFANFAAGAAVTQFDRNGGCAACTFNVQANGGKLELHVTGLVDPVRWSARMDYIAVGQTS